MFKANYYNNFFATEVLINLGLGSKTDYLYLKLLIINEIDKIRTEILVLKIAIE